MKKFFVRGHSAVAVVTVCMMVIMQAGCATVGGPKAMTGSQTDALKAKLGKIGVVGAGYLPKAEIKVPAKGAGQGAAGGAASGAVAPFEIMSGGMQGCNSPGCLLLPVLAVALVPVGAVVGGVGGAMTAEKAETVSEREATIKQSLAQLKIQENMRDRLLTRTSDLKTFPAAVVNDNILSSEGVSPDYRQLKGAGIDTVNEVVVQNFQLTGPGNVKPDLAVQMTAQVRLISTSNNTEMYSNKYVCTSKQDKFEAWAEQNARKFLYEIDNCYNDIANRAVNDMYINDTLLR